MPETTQLIVYSEHLKYLIKFQINSKHFKAEVKQTKHC